MVPSKLNGILELSTLTIETTTPIYDSLNERNDDEEETTTNKMRKVLKHIYKKPIHSETGESVNKQDVLLEFSNSKKNLLTGSNEKMTDAVESLNGTSTTSGNSNRQYKGSLEEGVGNDNREIVDAVNNTDDEGLERDHQSGRGMLKISNVAYIGFVLTFATRCHFVNTPRINC